MNLKKISFVILVVIASYGFAAPKKKPETNPKAKCPTHGMIVAPMEPFLVAAQAIHDKAGVVNGSKEQGVYKILKRAKWRKNAEKDLSNSREVTFGTIVGTKAVEYLNSSEFLDQFGDEKDGVPEIIKKAMKDELIEYLLVRKINWTNGYYYQIPTIVEVYLRGKDKSEEGAWVSLRYDTGD